MLHLVSSSSAPRNGETPESSRYVNTPTDQMSDCGKAGSSLSTSGAVIKNENRQFVERDFQELDNLTHRIQPTRNSNIRAQF